MGEYITSYKTTTSFKVEDAQEMLEAVKVACANYQPEYDFGWRGAIKYAGALSEVAFEFDIVYAHNNDGDIFPVLANTYRSGVLREIAKAVAPWMSDGEIRGFSSDGDAVSVEFKHGEAIF